MSKTAGNQPDDPTSKIPNSARHPIGGWRYVLIELGIVTAGLFIALMLSSVVDWVHHRQIVHEARSNIRREVNENRQKIRENLGYVRTSLTKVNANISTLHLILAGRFQHGSLSNGVDFDTFDETAWQTARDTGALSYMPYDEAQRYSGLYSTIDYANGRMLTLVDSQFGAMAPAEMGYDFARLPPDEVKSMLRANADAKVKLETFTQMLAELDAQLAGEGHTKSTR